MSEEDERFTETHRKQLRSMINAYNAGKGENIDLRSFVYYADMLLTQKEERAKKRMEKKNNARSGNNDAG